MHKHKQHKQHKQHTSRGSVKGKEKIALRDKVRKVFKVSKNAGRIILRATQRQFQKSLFWWRENKNIVDAVKGKNSISLWVEIVKKTFKQVSVVKVCLHVMEKLLWGWKVIGVSCWTLKTLEKVCIEMIWLNFSKQTIKMKLLLLEIRYGFFLL